MASLGIRAAPSRLIPVDRSAQIQIVVVVLGATLLGWMVASESWRVIAAGLGIMLLLARPVEIILAVYALLLPFESTTTMTGGSGPSATLLRYIALTAILIMLGLGALNHRLKRPESSSIVWSAFILWCSLSALWAIDRETALRRLPTALGLWLLYLVIASMRLTLNEFWRVNLAAVVGGVLASAYTAFNFFRMGGTAGRVSMNEGGDYADPNFFALTLLLPLSLAFGYVVSEQGWLRRGLSLAALGVVAIGLFLTMSRGALIAIAVIAGVFLVRLHFNWRMLLPIAVTVFGLMLMPHLFFERVGDFWASRMAGREDIWIIGLHSLRSYGGFGAGLDNFPFAFEKFVGSAQFFVGDQRASHNVYLTAAVEFGVLGFILLLHAVRLQLRALRKLAAVGPASSQFIAFEAACWGLLAAGLSLDVLWRKSFWFTWAIAAAATQIRFDVVAPIKQVEMGSQWVKAQR